MGDNIREDYAASIGDNDHILIQIKKITSLRLCQLVLQKPQV